LRLVPAVGASLPQRPKSCGPLHKLFGRSSNPYSVQFQVCSAYTTLHPFKCLEDSMKVDGSCHCGAITFEAEIDPERVRVCHCTDCQQLSGTAFRVMVPCIESQFHLLTGEPKVYIKTAESGRRRQQAFCSHCGSPIYATSDEAAGSRSLGLRVGILAQRRELTPKRQFWYRSVLPWLPALPGITEDGTAYGQ
jgi:hypothetical protein